MNTTGKKFGGRQAGTPNKKTNELKDWINNLLQDNKEQFEKDLKTLKASERLQILEKLLKYCVPIAPQPLDPALAIELEYSELERLLKELPEVAIEKLAKKILTLKNTEHEEI